ncbi:hypothetical protein KCP74_11650 [Salmonella enterica subsp. enterica]|nr:hypothetical protein KCP74_11650 [Salmonella enterica subsp. enterica]
MSCNCRAGHGVRWCVPHCISSPTRWPTLRICSRHRGHGRYGGVSCVPQNRQTVTKREARNRERGKARRAHQWQRCGACKYGGLRSARRTAVSKHKANRGVTG